jgi:DNA-binding CsgD family transcriptional regulator
VKTDTISIVEAAYNCEGDTRAWLDRLLEQAAPKLDRGFGVTVSTYVPNMPPETAVFEGHSVAPEIDDAVRAMITAYPQIFHRVLSSGPAHNTASGAMGLSPKQASTWPPYVEYLHPVGVRDIVGVLARDPSGHTVFMSVLSPDLRRPTRTEAGAWSRIAAHISAGSRLRRAIGKLENGEWAQGADAVLSPSGSMLHGEKGAQGVEDRDCLRRAVKAIDRARSKARSNEDEALDLWQGLIAGRWSLVEQFDSDGRRFMVARRNDPQVTDPRALSLRERQVLAYVAMGHPAKLIAYSLGVSPSSVSTSRQTGMRKLGLKTTTDVVRLFAEAPPSEPSQER